MDPRNRVLNGHATWRQLTNTVECAGTVSESATRSGNAACSQIILEILSLLVHINLCSREMASL